MDRYESTHYDDEFVQRSSSRGGRSSRGRDNDVPPKKTSTRGGGGGTSSRSKSRGRSKSQRRGGGGRSKSPSMRSESSRSRGTTRSRGSTLRMRSLSREQRGGGAPVRSRSPTMPSSRSRSRSTRGGGRANKTSQSSLGSRDNTRDDDEDGRDVFHDDDDDDDCEEATWFGDNTQGGGEVSKFTNVTIESYLPDNNNVVVDSGLKLGQCLYTELRNVNTWSWDFAAHQLLSGLAVASVQFPDCVGYAYVAGVDPFHALQATWIANVLTSIVGGRPGLVCGASGLGAVAVRVAAETYGREYVYYAVILSGFCQVLFGALRIGKYLRLLPPGVTIGMLNAICVMLMLLQVRYFKEFPGAYAEEDMDGDGAIVASSPAVSLEEPILGVVSTVDEPTRYLESVVGTGAATTTATEDGLNQPWAYFYGYDLEWTDSTSQILVVLLEAVAALLICFVMPRCVSIFPNSLAAIVVLALVNSWIRNATDWVAPTVGDYTASELPSSKLWQGMFHSSYEHPSLTEWSTLSAVVPAGLSLLCINLLETMVAINVVDKYTATDSEQDRVFYGQGVANLTGALMGGMGSAGLGHASLHGARLGGVTSVSVFLAGLYMLAAMTFAWPLVGTIPLGATAGVTAYLVLNAVQWTPIASLALKLVPARCLGNSARLGRFRLAVPDLFSTFVSSAITLCGSPCALAGFATGVLCYACDPIGHAIILNDDGDGYAFATLEFSKPPGANKTTQTTRRKPWHIFTRTNDEYTEDSRPSRDPMDREQMYDDV